MIGSNLDPNIAVDRAIKVDQAIIDEQWMRYAIALAERAEMAGEVPVGAVIVRGNQMVGEGWNQPISSVDPTAHAEVVALRMAAKVENNYRLSGSTLYVTLEPCTMCVGALVHARIERLVYGTTEPKAGAVASKSMLLESAYFNHRVNCSSGVLAAECQHQLSHFFKQRRAQLKETRRQNKTAVEDDGVDE